MPLTHLDDGRLLLLEEIGKGGMASVRRVRCLRSGEQRAVKILAPHLSKRGALRQRFLREAQVLKSLEHPGICRVYAAGIDQGLPWIELELVQGQSLHHWMRHHRQPMPPGMAVTAMLGVCEAVAYAHGQGVIHRDLKPENILVDPQERVRVVDFGIARLLDAAGTTRTGIMMGSMGFMAPEQKDDAKRVDARADVFSLCASLGTLLSYRDPRALDEMLEVLSETVSEALLRVVVRGVASDAEHRHQDVGALIRRLRRAQGELQQAPSPNSLYLPLQA